MDDVRGQNRLSRQSGKKSDSIQRWLDMCNSSFNGSDPHPSSGLQGHQAHTWTAYIHIKKKKRINLKQTKKEATSVLH